MSKGVLAYELTAARGWRRQLPVHTLPHQQNANSMGQLLVSMPTAGLVLRAWLRCKHVCTAKETVGQTAWGCPGAQPQET